ncbi:MAG: NMD3-related protein [Promethearchaeota archaeon]
MDNVAPQCIVCGSHKIFFSRLCQQCYLENHPILKQKSDIYITACENCELLSIKGHWTNFLVADIGKPALNTNLSKLLFQEWTFYYRPHQIQIRDVNIESSEEGQVTAINGSVEISASPDAFVPLMTISENFTIHTEWGRCSECRDRLSGSYSSKIQIRSPKKVDNKQLETWSDEIETISQSFLQSDGKNPLFRIDFLRSGLDAFFQTKSTANSVAREFAKKHGGFTSVTTEFAGFDKSKSKEYPRKPVVLITLPEFNPGDIVILKQEPIKILGYNSKVEFWDFKKKIKVKLPIKSFITSKPQILDEDFKQFQLVNFEKGGMIAQVMNTENFETHYIDSSEISDLSEGDTFEGISYNGRLLRIQKET